jgi:hypothetical protein
MIGCDVHRRRLDGSEWHRPLVVYDRWFTVCRYYRLALVPRLVRGRWEIKVLHLFLLMALAGGCSARRLASLPA